MTILVHPQSELIREPRLLVPGMKPLGPVKYIGNYKPLAFYAATACTPAAVQYCVASLTNKAISVANGSVGVVASATASSIAITGGCGVSAGYFTVIQQVKFPLTNAYENFLQGGNGYASFHCLIRNASNNVLAVWDGSARALLDVSAYSGLHALVTRHTDGYTDIFTSKGDYGSVANGCKSFLSFWGDATTAGRSVTFGCLFIVLAGAPSAAECASFARDPWQLTGPA